MRQVSFSLLMSYMNRYSETWLRPGLTFAAVVIFARGAWTLLAVSLVWLGVRLESFDVGSSSCH